jgi:DNA-binding transcriptional ArsR family regulator
MTAADLLARLDGVKRSSTGHVARCPAHDDQHQSLSIDERDGRLLLKCHAGCSFESILAAAGGPGPTPETTYDYRDASGQLVYQVVRRPGKRFTQRRSDGADGWVYSLEGVQRLPYRLPELLAHPRKRGVVVVEGEKDVDRLASLGVVATCNSGGAGKWDPAYAEHLRDRRVVIIPDNDEAGRAHAADVAASLAGTADVRLLELDGLPLKGDVSNWLDAGHTAEEFRALLLAAPAFQSAGPTPPSGRMHFRTARDLAAETSGGVAWIARPWLAAGAITELDGRPKAAGKTTLLSHLIAAVLDGREFLGEPTAVSPAVLLSEQPPASLRETLGRASLLERDDLHVLLWRDVRGATWPTIVEAAVEQCRTVGARVLIVDTLPQFAGLRGDAENDSGAALEALAPLQSAAADGLGILIARHDRKGGGEVGESARGSSAFTGGVDVVLALRRGDGEARPTIRHLSALSRFDETPPELVIELTRDGYVALGSTDAYAVSEARRKALEALADGELRVEEIAEATGVRRTTLQVALSALERDGQVRREGKGRKGDPYRYQLINSEAGDSFRRSYMAAETNSPPALPLPDPHTNVTQLLTSETVTVDCRDFRGHQSSHRIVRGRATCDACAA